MVGLTARPGQKTADAGVLRDAVGLLHKRAGGDCGGIVLALKERRDVSGGKVAHLPSGACSELEVEVAAVGAAECHALGGVGVGEGGGASSRGALVGASGRYKKRRSKKNKMLS